MSSKEGIVIVGMDCRYPGANSLDQYWENIISLRQQFRRIPDKRLNLSYYLSRDRSVADSTYSEKASVLSGYQFDRLKYRVAKSTFDQTDMTHWLALDVAAGALKDAGFENGDKLDKQCVGVIIGNSLTGEFTRANIMRLRWPYVANVLASSLKELNLGQEEISKCISIAEKKYKSPFPEPNADTLAGGLSNTIAGRICNYFDFNGGGYTIDGACASSLLAFVNGCNSIMNDEIDVALVGGVDLSIDPFETIGFARNGALALNEMEVYSTRSEGFWPGEGCGIVVLMKASQAKRLGARIYSVIKGWGISSDGNGGVTRPKSDTQQIAFKRAYQRAGYNIDSIAMFEGHGTGTPLGDKVEITALVNSLREAEKKDKPAVLGSVKHLIGHTKAAAGVAGVIKAALSLRYGIIPASRPNIPHTILQENSDVIRLGEKPTLWDSADPMRASILSMGFGGINVHLTMEEVSRTGRQKSLPTKVKKLSDSTRDYEVFPIAAHSKESFLGKTKKLASLARDISRSEFVDLSATICASFESSGEWKASFVSKSPEQLLDSLTHVNDLIFDGKTRHVDIEKGIFFNASNHTGKLGFLFPGQGAPLYTGTGAFSQFSAQRSDVPVNFSADREVIDTSVAQPVIVKSTLDSLALLDRFGVDVHFGVGHSLGEICALHWTGAIEKDIAVDLAKARGRAMSKFGEPGGALLALKCNEEDLQELIKDHKVWITGYNGQGNFVVGGAKEDIARVQNAAFNLAIHGVQLKVSHAFHTPMMKQAALQFKDTLAKLSFGETANNIVSTVTGEFLDGKMLLADLLFKQIEAPVLLTHAIEKIKDDVDFLFEVGPGKTLSKSLSEYNEFNVIALDYGSNSLKGFLSILSAAFISGSNVLFEELSVDRFYRKFDTENWMLDVLANPCENLDFEAALFQNVDIKTIEQKTSSTDAKPAQSSSSDLSVKDFLKKIISEKTEIPINFINDEDKIMSQLHINSLAITEIISLVIKAYNKSQRVFSEVSILANSDGSILELSELIVKGESGNMLPSGNGQVNFDLTTNWTHVFMRKQVARKLPNIKVQRSVGEILVGGVGILVDKLNDVIYKEKISAGNGSIYVYSTLKNEQVLNDFVHFLNQPKVRNGDFVLLVGLLSEDDKVDLKPILRTFQQEAPHLTVSSVEIDERIPDKEKLILAEVKSTTKYKEVIYDQHGARFESELACVFPVAVSLTDVISINDVILVTGGGKGITFESIYSLAQNTGAKLLIVGRATPDDDAMLFENLNRLTNAKITFRYFSADVSNPTDVKAAMAQGVNELGDISIILHGAGFNKPRTLNLLTEEDFRRTYNVKVGGLHNVINSLDASKLKLLIGYGSIIAESGMHGNADYAWSNNELARYISDFAGTNAHCRCLTLEWSVWDEVGMGVSLNIIDNLKERGVWPIPLAKGIEILKSIISDTDCVKGNYIISGRYGNIPTLNYTKARLPIGRFISKIKYHIPDVEIVSDVSINLNDDIYLRNHVFQNQYVFPTVMVLEGFAQVCSVLMPPKTFWVYENLKINKSIFLSKSAVNIVRFIVTRISENCFRAVVQSEDSNFEVNCFEALINLSKAPGFNRNCNKLLNGEKLTFDVKKNFYEDLLFHTGPFRRIKSFLKIQAQGSLAVAESSLHDEWFGPYIATTCQLGDPGLNDAAIHCHQACRPGYSLLPTSAETIAVNTENIEGPFFIETTELKEEKSDTHIDVCVFNAKGEVKIYWKNLVLTRVSGTKFDGAWDPHLLVPYVEYHINKLSQSRSTKLPMQNWLQVFKSLQTDGTHESDVDGFTISLRKQNADQVDVAPPDFADDVIVSTGKFASRINVANVTGKVLIEITQQN